ncbi:MAG: Crp/Fnr family transcriptional regulator [Bacteroidetes bacterium]|nr:MAG: Crp/Fnr family transcriptional regulator [Bacteroidota bacterium]
MSNGSNIWYLEQVNMFDYFCPITHSEERYNKQPKRSFKRAEFIYFNEDSADKVFFIDKGAVKIGSYSPDGNELIKAILYPGEIFGELALYGEEKRSDFAQAMEPTEICSLSRMEVVSLMYENMPLNDFFNALIGQRVVYTQKRMEALLFKDVRTRIIDYILEQAMKNGKTLLDGRVLVRNYLTHQEIANYTGASRQTVTSVLNELRDLGILDFDRKRIVIRMPEQLKKAATPPSAGKQA